jgi:hypothetical protein
MKKSTTTEAPYPYNLVDEILPVEAPERALMDDDQLKGLDYAINTYLSDRERDILILYFKDGLTLDDVGAIEHVTRERVRQIVAKACRKLRHPCARAYIERGFRTVSGELEAQASARWADEIRSLEARYVDRVNDLRKKIANIDQRSADMSVIADVIAAKNFIDDIDASIASIASMDLSVRSYNCLWRAGIRTVGAICEKSASELLCVRNLGRRSFDEIVSTLHARGMHLKEAANDART